MSSWTPEALRLSGELAESLRDDGYQPGDSFFIPSKSEPGVLYEMVVIPEGYAVHQNEGCAGEPFNGPLGCYHSKENSNVTQETALATVNPTLTPAPIDFTDEQLSVIKTQIAKGATNQELELFVATCRRTGLDPFLKQIYAIKRYDSRAKGEVMAIQVGIDGLRLIAERTNRYAGQDPVEFLDEDGVWSMVWTAKGHHPIAARCTVYRKDWPNHAATAVCRWESYAQYLGADKRLSPTWAAMPDVMLGKCAEALALRRAFPAEMSGMAAAIDTDYDPVMDAREQEQANVVEVQVPSYANVADAAPPDSYVRGDIIDGEVIESPSETVAEAEPPVEDEPVSQPAPEAEPAPAQSNLIDLDSAMHILDNIAAIETKHGDQIAKEFKQWVVETYPYAVDKGIFRARLLNPEDGAKVLAAAHQTYEQRPAPAPRVSH